MENCKRCGKQFVRTGIGTGYGVNHQGEKICYQCCGEIDREELRNAKPGDKFCYYLTEKNGSAFVGNWPDTFKIIVHPRTSRHNFGLTRRDFWFQVGEANFHGFQIGENTQIAHIRCIKYL